MQLILLLEQNCSLIFMYPNNPPKQQPQPQPQHINLNYSQQPHLTSNHQPTFLMPSQNQNNRAVFSSMIQPPTSNQQTPKSGGLSKLESMGRFIKQQPDPVIKVIEPTFQNTQTTNFNFRNQAFQRPKMSSSVIFAKGSDQQLNRFPMFVNQGTGTSRLQALMSNKNKQVDIQKQDTTQSKQEKRKKQIESIKQQMYKLNKKMQTFSFKTSEENSAESKPYFQLATRKNNPTNLQNTNQSNPGDSNMNFFRNYSNSSTASNHSTSSSPLNSVTHKELHQNQNQYLNTVTQQHKPPIQLQHCVSGNEFNIPSFAKRQENNGAMFKKKNGLIGNQVTQNTPKAFHLSPRSHFKLPEQSQTIKASQVTEFKPAENMDIVSPKKGLRRIQSVDTEDPNFQTSFSNSKDYGVKEFKKSDFTIGKKMGKGQFGQVMLVQHKKTGFICGLKVMSKKQIREQKYENQVARELAIQFYLNHRNVAPLYGYFSDQQNVYLLVQFCTNGQLLQLLRKAHRMQQAECSPIIREICEGLDYIHKEQIIHRDIKPQNILFNFNTVKICDFGWAVYSGNGMRKTVAGSPLYYSPEVVLQTKYDQKIDIWAIGMMTYECLLGKIPFRIYSQLDLNRIVQDQIKFPEYVDVTDEAKDFILKICKKNPQQRMEMREILRHPFITKYLKQKKQVMKFWRSSEKSLTESDILRCILNSNSDILPNTLILKLFFIRGLAYFLRITLKNRISLEVNWIYSTSYKIKLYLQIFTNNILFPLHIIKFVVLQV